MSMSSEDRKHSSSIDEEEIFIIGDQVIVRKNRINKDSLINNIIMYHGIVVGKQRCKPAKDKTYDDHKNSYCV